MIGRTLQKALLLLFVAVISRWTIKKRRFNKQVNSARRLIRERRDSGIPGRVIGVYLRHSYPNDVLLEAFLRERFGAWVREERGKAIFYITKDRLSASSQVATYRRMTTEVSRSEVKEFNDAPASAY
jgi:hypothetical protein